VEGLTLRDTGLEATPFWVAPSDQVKFQGPLPVSAAWIVVELPLQMVAVPLTTAVGRALTVAVVVPAAELQPFTVTITLYVPDAAGVALGIEGFCVEELKPLGPVQL
jgi:hypothetical protein